MLLSWLNNRFLEIHSYELLISLFSMNKQHISYCTFIRDILTSFLWHKKSITLFYPEWSSGAILHIEYLRRWFLVNDQRDAQFFSMYLFIFLTLYMFRAHRAYPQERQIVSIQPLVAVTLCQWPCRVHTKCPPTQSDSHQRLYWHKFFLSWW